MVGDSQFFTIGTPHSPVVVQVDTLSCSYLEGSYLTGVVKFFKTLRKHLLFLELLQERTSRFQSIVLLQSFAEIIEQLNTKLAHLSPQIPLYCRLLSSEFNYLGHIK